MSCELVLNDILHEFIEPPRKFKQFDEILCRYYFIIDSDEIGHWSLPLLCKRDNQSRETLLHTKNQSL